MKILMLVSIVLCSISAQAFEDITDLERNNVVNIEKMLEIKKALEDAGLMEREKEYIEKALSTDILAAAKGQKTKGPTTVCKNGHRWICFRNTIKDSRFKTMIEGSCNGPMGDSSCFQAY